MPFAVSGESCLLLYLQPHFSFCSLNASQQAVRRGVESQSWNILTGETPQSVIFTSSKLPLLTIFKKKKKRQSKQLNQTPDCFFFIFSHAHLIWSNCKNCKSSKPKRHSQDTAVLALSSTIWSLTYLCGTSRCPVWMCRDSNVLLRGDSAFNEEVLGQGRMWSSDSDIECCASWLAEE